MELLLGLEDRGYPVEYLLSRIRGRRAELIKDWKVLLFDASPLDVLLSPRARGSVSKASPDAVWRRLIKEYRWVYSQMNKRLRETFSLYFLYSELRTVFICLRHIKDGKAARFEELLNESLLSTKLRSLLMSAKDLPTAVAGVSRMFAALSPEFEQINDRLEDEGLRGVERRLTNRYLAYAASTASDALIRAFMARMVDSRNLIRLIECVQQDAVGLPDFIDHGSIPLARLNAIQGKRDLSAANALIREYTGEKNDLADAVQTEHALYAGTSKYLRLAGRDIVGMAPILDYLWQCSIEAMNLSILFYGKDIERDVISAELVR